MQMVTDERYFWWHLNGSGTFDEQSNYLVIYGITMVVKIAIRVVKLHDFMIPSHQKV